ncbi:MAG: Erythromycin esterase [Caulobacteraceae bacterium]|nr:Erythromycin esterase [Caulobacteraceae bacterium]
MAVRMTKPASLFADRAAAGRALAPRLRALHLPDPVVYALPRGGVPVAARIAKALAAPLDLILVRKIGVQGQPELALAAIVEGDTIPVVNEEVMAMVRPDPAYLDEALLREIAEIERRRTAYLGERPRIDPAGRTAIVVDDGLATGATAKAALRSLRRQGARRLVLAVPVAPPDTLEAMRDEADDVVCLVAPRPFHGVGAFYDDFHQLTDEEMIAVLREVWSDAGDRRRRTRSKPSRSGPEATPGFPGSPRGDSSG